MESANQVLLWSVLFAAPLASSFTSTGRILASRLAFSAVLCLVSPLLVNAGVCVPSPVAKESAYAYGLAYASALGHASYAQADMDSAGQGDDPTTVGTSLMIALRRSQSEYECASSLLAPYISSHSAAIASSADGASKIFGKLAELKAETMESLRKVMDAGPAAQGVSGTLAEKTAEITDTQDKALSAVVFATTLATYAMVEADPKSGLMSHLALTRAQRDEILGSLRSDFGDEIVEGPKEGQYPLVGSAALFYKVLADSARTLRPDKKPSVH